MKKREIHFEGLIEGAYSQILADKDSGKWLLLGHIKNDELSKVMANVERINQTRSDEEKIRIVLKKLNRKKAAFLEIEISQDVALEQIEKNQKSQIQGKTKIKDIRSLGNRIYLTDTPEPLKPASGQLLQKIKQASPVRVAAGVLGVALIVGAVTFASYKANTQPSATDFTTPPAYTNAITTPEEAPEVVNPRVDLEDLVLDEQAGGKLNSSSVKKLAASIVDELDELYKNSEYELPKIVGVETLSSIFFFESDCKPVDSKEDDYVGIAQIGIDAVEAAIIRADRKFKALQEDAVFSGGDNYIIDNICSHGQEVSEFARVLWERAKTDPKLCGMISALYLADLSDRNTTKLQENSAAIITMYNAGEGNFEKFENLGIITLSEDKKNMTIDLSKVDRITDPKLLKKWNEAVNYLILVSNGHQDLTDNPNADIHILGQQIRDKVGKNDNYNIEPNMEQYKYAPKGVSFIGLELEQGVQPGE